MKRRIAAAGIAGTIAAIALAITAPAAIGSAADPIPSPTISVGNSPDSTGRPTGTYTSPAGTPSPASTSIGGFNPCHPKPFHTCP